MPKTTLIPLLASGEYCSGQALAGALGVSRTAIWKQLNALSELGLEIESVKGRGYRIPGGIDLLDESRIRADLSGAAAGHLSRLLLLETTDSTNAEAMRQLDSGASTGLVPPSSKVRVAAGVAEPGSAPLPAICICPSPGNTTRAQPRWRALAWQLG